jgi:hypothetical protein
VPTPTDAPGWCVKTLHDFQADATSYIGGRGLAVSPDGRYVYVAPTGVDVLRIDTTTWTVTNPWVTPSAFNLLGIAADAAGNVYVSLSDNTIAKITATGTVTTGWATAPVGWQFNAGLSLGADGNLYVTGLKATGEFYTVFKISLVTGAVSEILPLRAQASDVGYDYATALSDGTVFVTLDPPPSAGPNANVNTTLRRYTPSTSSPTYTAGGGGVVTQTGIGAGNVILNSGGAAGQLQLAILSLTGSATLSMAGGYSVIASVTTGTVTTYVLARTATGTGNVNLPVTASGRWYAQGGMLSVSGLDSAVIGDVGVAAFDGATTLTDGTFDSSGEAVIFGAGGWFAVDDPGPLPTVGEPSSDGFWTARHSISSFGDQLTPAGTGSQVARIWSAPPNPSVAPSSTASTTAHGHAAVVYIGRALVEDVAIQTLVDLADDGSTEAYGGLLVDNEDHLIIPMTRYGSNGTTTANLGWWLRVAADGTAARVAGTWSYTSSPGPAATSTDIADGALVEALCARLDRGAGISADRRTVYFVDDSDELGGIAGNLLRVRARCVGWQIHAQIIG